MILERLTFTSEPSLTLSLGPRFAYVPGLGAVGRSRVIDAVAALLEGRCEGVSGSALVNGVRFDIPRELAEMLALLDLPSGPVDLVLGRDLVDAAWADAQLADSDDYAQELAEDRLMLEAVAESLAARRATAETALISASVAAGLGPAAKARRAELEAELAAISAERAVLAEHRARAAEAIAGHRQRALQAATDAGEAGTGSPGPREALADRVAQLSTRMSTRVEAASSVVPEWLRTQAAEQLAEAKADVSRLDVELIGSSITAVDGAALEAAHAAVDRAEDKAQRWFASPLAKHRLDAAIQAEQEIQDRLGVASYATFVMQQASGAIADPRMGSMVEAARAALVDAEALWQVVTGPVDADVTLDDDDVSVRAEAAALLGLDDSLAAAMSLGEIERLVRTVPEPVALPGEFDLLRHAELASFDKREAELQQAADVIRGDLDAGAPPAGGEAAERLADAMAGSDELVSIDHEHVLLDLEWERLRERATRPAPPSGDGVASGLAGLVRIFAERAERHRLLGFGLPLVVDDALAGLPAGIAERALTALVAVSGGVQIVYLADGDELASLAATVGLTGVVAGAR